MQVTGFVKVSRSGDIQRMVRWEESWVPVGDGYEARKLNPTIWEWTYLDVSNPRRIEYTGPEFKWVPTAITRVPWVGTNWSGLALGFAWPREVPTETEFVRRDRIRRLREVCHIDEDKGETEPAWVPEVPASSHVLHVSAGTISAAA